MNVRNTRRSRVGFSFAELLVVMAILGILSGLAVPRIRGMKRKAYITTMVTDLRNLAATQEQFWTDGYVYSNDFVELKYHHSLQVTVTILEATGNGWSASATHADVSISCAVFYGSATPVPPAAENGVISCG